METLELYRVGWVGIIEFHSSGIRNGGRRMEMKILSCQSSVLIPLKTMIFTDQSTRIELYKYIKNIQEINIISKTRIVLISLTNTRVDLYLGFFINNRKPQHYISDKILSKLYNNFINKKV